jgi:capsular exopolysaccharide synthesis family protein
MSDKRPDNQSGRPNLPAALLPQGHRSTSVRHRVPMESPESAPSISPQRVLEAIRYWWKWALPTGAALATIGGLTVYLLFEPKYEATAWIQIQEQAPFIAFETKGEISDSKAFVATQIELLRSPMIVGPILVEPEVAALPEVLKQDNPVDWMRKQVAVKRVGESELYTVSFACSRSKAAKRAVNSILESYFSKQQEKLTKQSDTVKKLLQGERENLEKQVEELRKSVRDMAERVTGRDPFKEGAEPAANETTPLAGLVTQLIACEVEDTVLSARLKVLNAVDVERTSLVPASMLEAAVAEDPKIQQATDDLAGQRLQIGNILAGASRGKDSPEYKRAVDRYSRSQVALEELKKEIRKQSKVKLESMRMHEHQQALAKLNTDLENCRVTKKMLEERYAKEMHKVEKSTGDSVSLKFEQDKLAQKERVLEVIAERIVVLSTEQNAPERVVLYQDAELPLAPVQALPYLNLLIAVVGGFFAPFGLAVLKEQLTGRVVDADHAERNAYLTILGEVTALPSRTPRRGRLEHHDNRSMHIFQESIEALRSRLLLSDSADSLRILTVVSAINKEGKTSVAVQLAASIARATQKRVLVIDGDLRDPSVHQVFDVPRMPGLTNVLSGECSIDYAIVATRTELVDVLSAGYLDGNPHRLVEERRWSKLIDSVPPEYRYVIVDTPPVLSASEALVLARRSDAVLVCAMRNVTRLAQLKKATERVVSAGAKVAGMVLSGVPLGQYADRYGSYFFETD